VPNLDKAVVPATKVTDYLLSETYLNSKHKASLFRPYGFSLDNWQTLEQAVRQHIFDHDVANVESSPFGVRYAVYGAITAADRRSTLVRTVWFIGPDWREEQDSLLLLTNNGAILCCQTLGS